MKDERISRNRICPHCGAVIDADAPRCFLCLTRVGPPEQAQPEPLPPLPDIRRTDSPNHATTLAFLAVLGIAFVGILSVINGGPVFSGFLVLLILVAVPFFIHSWHA